VSLLAEFAQVVGDGSIHISKVRLRPVLRRDP
jgi:hypothetical protein